MLLVERFIILTYDLSHKDAVSNTPRAGDDKHEVKVVLCRFVEEHHHEHSQVYAVTNGNEQLAIEVARQATVHVARCRAHRRDSQHDIAHHVNST